jgi:hypothetical protein
LDVGDGGLKLGKQVVDLGALPLDLVKEEGILRLRRLKAGVELGLVGDEGGGHVRSEDSIGRKEMGPLRSVLAEAREGGEVGV